MKTLQSSSRGRGGRGRGRGRGGGGRGGSGGRGGRGDQRFASRFTDPRFQLSNRVQQKQHRRPSPHEQISQAAKSDPRFAKHLKDQLHASEDDSETYASEEDDEEDEEAPSVDASRAGSDAASSRSEESNEEEEEEEDTEEADMDDDDDEVAAWQPDEVEFIEAKHRIAVVNCDWDHVRAVDLYAIFFNALPLGGQLKEVCVYMSDFGKRMIEHERALGPDLWVKPGEEDVASPEGDAEGAAVEEVDDVAEDLVEDSEEEEPVEDGWEDDNPAMLNEQGEDGEYFSSGKYRKYEMDRMKYYYAVATFDSADTAAAVYNELDGMDIEASGVVLDLRYIDDDESFENPVSRADSIPPRFKPLSSFRAAALTNTRFRISWDQDDVFRHQSVQDSFTGTTEEDDLAAYLAPPDSDEDDDVRDTKTGRTKAEEKARIRRKYASLLEEIGGIPEENGDEDGSGGGASSGSGDDSESDDDSLNRFSDVEMESGAEDDEDDDDDEVMGDMEATLDLDAGTKAAHLQRDARLKQKLKDGTLAERAEVIYKRRRKEMKKAKKAMAIEEREAEKEALAATRDEQKRKLKALLNTDDDGAVHLSGKERRKQHAKEVKQRLAEERASRKQMRMASTLGVTQQAKQTLEVKEAEQALGTIDPRFQSKLLSDPRFHLEVATKDKRISDDVQELAATVAKARRGKRPADDSTKATDRTPNNTNGGNDMDSTVGYFLNKGSASRPPAKKPRRG